MSLEEILAEIPKLSNREAEKLKCALAERETGGRTVFEAAGHLFDGVEGLPADLSTNPKYMEGFGK